MEMGKKHEQDDEKKNKIKLTVVTTDGNFSNDFNIHQTLQHIIDVTIRELNLAIDQSQYELVKQGSTDALDLNMTIDQALLKNEDVLQYQMINSGGGIK